MSLTYYNRIRNSYDRAGYDSPDDREYEIDRWSERHEYLEERANYYLGVNLKIAENNLSNNIVGN